MSFKPGRSPVAAFFVVALLMVAPAAASAADIVVSNNTSGPGPAGADCSNPDHATIQAGLSAAAPGDRVLVCAGTYTGNAAIAQDDVSLLGPQAGVDARTRSVPAAEEAVFTGSLNASNRSGFEVDGLTFDNTGAGGTRINAPGNNTGDYVIQNNILSGGIRAITLASSGPDTAVVRRNAFRGNNSQTGGSASTGIYGDNVIKQLRIADNSFSDGFPAIVLNPNLGSDPDGGQDVEIVGNSMDGADSGTAVAVYKTDNLLIADNEISEGGSSKIFLGGGLNGASVTGNTVSGGSFGVAVSNQFGFGPSSGLEIVGNDVTGNGTGITAAFNALTDTLAVHANRIVGNSNSGVGGAAAAQIDATENWWGCNDGPGQPGCDSANALASTDPWLVLSFDGPTSILAEATESYEAAVTATSDGGTASNPGAFPAAEVSFDASAGSIDSPQSLVASVASTDYTAPNLNTTVELSSTLDSETQTLEVNVTGAPLTPTRIVARPMLLDDYEPIVRIPLPLGRLQAQLFDSSDDTPIAGKEIIFNTSSGRELCRATTDQIGVAMCVIELDSWLQALLQLRYQAWFAGDANTEAAWTQGQTAHVLRLIQIPG